VKFFQHLITFARLLFCLIFLSMSIVIPVEAQIIPTKPVQTEISQEAPLGVFLTQIGDFDVQKKSFSATFWLWTQTGNAEKSILDSIEFPNAVTVKVSDNITNPTATGKWLQRKVIGTFRHNWDMRNFPFDSQKLIILAEESDRDLSKLRYVPDQKNSSIDEDIKIDGWAIKRYSIEPLVKKYRSNFGDPSLPSGSSSEYTSMQLKIELQRNDLNGFFKLTAGAFAAAGLALVSYLLHADSAATLGPRLGLLAGSMFAVVISLRSASNELGTMAYLTLVDCVHLGVMFYILAAAATEIYILYDLQKHNNAIASKKIGIRAAIFSTLVFFTFVGVLIWGAIHHS